MKRKQCDRPPPPQIEYFASLISLTNDVVMLLCTLNSFRALIIVKAEQKPADSATW